ncbi:type VI secretion system tube protein Hcp [Rubinisphaera sp. JC750]|uniref:type VI secretion system tube protein Hcp n=1 Tax=Rubinisphaera sp. JC750 TaxID=2898658 RepID=UPI001F3C8893|nr:type VI secretion system tube protein Hcp [Rubinisphaera sp. JC750]
MAIGYLALQFQTGSDTAQKGWFPTGSVDKPATTFEIIPATTSPWQSVKRFFYGATREYGGINSSGGPQHSGRPDQHLIRITREADLVSPKLYKYCCNGYQLQSMLFITETDSGESLTIVYCEACHVVEFETQHFHAAATDYSHLALTLDGQSVSNASNSFTQSKPTLGDVKVEDELSILYTKMIIGQSRIVGGERQTVWQGWDTAAEKHWDTALTMTPPA